MPERVKLCFVLPRIFSFIGRCLLTTCHNRAGGTRRLVQNLITFDDMNFLVRRDWGHWLNNPPAAHKFSCFIFHLLIFSKESEKCLAIESANYSRSKTLSWRFRFMYRQHKISTLIWLFSWWLWKIISERLSHLEMFRRFFTRAMKIFTFY